jgi:hypothetical protein
VTTTGGNGQASGPVEKVRELADETERGRSPWTPFLALTGVWLVVAVAVGVIVAVVLTLYFAVLND